MVQIFRSVATQQKVDLQFQTIKDSCHPYADSDKLEKVLFLILGDALQASRECGTIAVTAGFSDS